MSIFDNLINVFKKDITITNFTTNNVENISSDDLSDTILQSENVYKKSLYLQAGLLKIKEAVSSIDFELYKIINTKGEVQKIEVHEILNLLYKPNPIQTKSEFWRILSANFKLSGECFIRVVYQDNANKRNPVALMSISPLDIDVKLNKDATLSYELRTDIGNSIKLTSLDIIHIKDPDTSNILRGSSILAPVLRKILAEINADKYQSNQFGNNGRPDGIITMKTSADATVLRKIKEGFLNSFTGANNNNKVAVIQGAEYQPISNSSNILDYVNSQKYVRDDIMIALGVPKSLVTTDDINRANAEAGLQQFMQFTIAPIIRLFLEVINERFIIPNYGEEYYIDTNKIMIEDKEYLLKEAQAGINKWLTPNEVRQRYSLDPLDGGDILNTTNVSYAMSDPSFVMNMFKTRPQLYKKLKERELIQKKLTLMAFNKLKASSFFKEKYVRAIDEVRQNAEKKITQSSKTYFKEQQARILKRLNDVGTNFSTASDLIDKEQEKKEIINTITPNFVKIAETAGNVALTPIKSIIDKKARFVVNSVSMKQIEKRASMLSDSMTNTTYDKISTIIAENMHEGIDVVAREIKNTFSDFSLTRALTIARTESAYITSLGQELAYQDSAVVAGKEWLSSKDDKVRPEHVENDGQVVGKDEAFSNGEHFPAESSINCRCAIAPIVDINSL